MMLRRPQSVSVHEQDGKNALSVLEQDLSSQEMQVTSEEAQALNQRRELGMKLSAIEQARLGELNARTTEIKQDFHQVDEQRGYADAKHIEREMVFQRAGFVGRFAKQVGLGAAAEFVGIQTEDRMVAKTHVDIQKAQRMDEASRVRVNEN